MAVFCQQRAWKQWSWFSSAGKDSHLVNRQTQGDVIPDIDHRTSGMVGIVGQEQVLSCPDGISKRKAERHRQS